MIIRYYHPFQFHMKHDANLILDSFKRNQLDVYLSVHIDRSFQIFKKKNIGNFMFLFQIMISDIDCQI